MNVILKVVSRETEKVHVLEDDYQRKSWIFFNIKSIATVLLCMNQQSPEH